MAGEEVKKPNPIKGDADYAIFEAGMEEGRRLMQAEVLGYLETAYMKPHVTRESTEGKAILKVAVALSNFMKKLKW